METTGDGAVIGLPYYSCTSAHRAEQVPVIPRLSGLARFAYGYMDD